MSRTCTFSVYWVHQGCFCWQGSAKYLTGWLFSFWYKNFNRCFRLKPKGHLSGGKCARWERVIFVGLKPFCETGFARRTRGAFLGAECEITHSGNGKSTSEEVATEGWNWVKAVPSKVTELANISPGRALTPALYSRWHPALCFVLFCFFKKANLLE